ncbi:adenylate/guanylate cyclase domain-containing protein [Bacteroidota bacterium]
MTSDRRLAAIMFTDIVGYTALMGRDEEKAFQLLRKNRDLQRPLIRKYQGEWLKEMGDGILASFKTSSDAVRCAREIQNASKKEDIPLRIGIHEGEVVFEGKDVLGDGVNVASRLEALTEEGCVYISESVYRNIKNKPDISADFIGEKALKNVDESIKVYKVDCEKVPVESPSLKAYDTSLPDKKSIIVLPFDNMSPDPDQEYFSDGLTEEIITDLSHVHDLLVISRSSAMTFKGTKSTIREIAEKVNVHYVLEGSVRKAGNSLRITAQLIDAITDTHLWAEKYNGTLDDIFKIQESVSREIVESLKLQLLPEESGKLSDKPITNIQAYECWLKARQAMFQWTAESLDYAKQYLETGLDIIGENPLLYAGMGFLHVQYFNSGVIKDPSIFKKAEKYIQKAFELDPDVFLGHYAMGFALYLQGDIKTAIAHIRKAIEMDPGNTDAMRLLCYYYSMMLGKPESVVHLAQRIIDLNPLTSMSYMPRAMVHWAMGDIKNAKEDARKYYRMSPDNIHARLWYTIILMWDGDYKETYPIIEKTKYEFPDETMTKIMLFLYYANQNDKDMAISMHTNDYLAYAWNDHFYAWILADGYALLNEKNEALKWLERTVDLGFINYPLFTEIDPFLNNLRETTEFKALMKRVKKEWEEFEV